MKNTEYSNRIVSIIKKGGVGVVPTDTLYGLVGSALIPEAVERIYALRHRETSKPFIVLIASSDAFSLFGIKQTLTIKKVIAELWPGPVSIIFPCRTSKYRYLHRGKNSLAFRLPADGTLRRFLEKTGPLVAPSVNPSGKKPAHTIQEAKRYFKKDVDFYVNGGIRKGLPSAVIRFKGKRIVVIRERGATKT